MKYEYYNLHLICLCWTLFSGFWPNQFASKHSLPHCVSHRLVSLQKLHCKTETSTARHHLHANCLVSSQNSRKLTACVLIHSFIFSGRAYVLMFTIWKWKLFFFFWSSCIICNIPKNSIMLTLRRKYTRILVTNSRNGHSRRWIYLIHP